ncbi:MAG: DinB family protein [Aurantibacter sp.]
MASELEHIINNLEECFDGKPWYGISVMKKLDAIPWETVNDQKYGSKTIAVLVQHIINWRIFLLKKLEGDTEYDLKIDGPTDWTEVYMNNQQEWDELKRSLLQTQDALLDKLSQATEELLKKQVPGKNYTFLPILTSISQHDIYHLGQIAMLNAMQGS